jgi:ribonuclease G
VRESVGRLTTEACSMCDGRGHVRSKGTIAYEIMRECQRAAKKHREDQLVVGCHPEVAKILQGPERDAMRLLMMKLNKSIVVRPQPQYHVEQYDLHGKWSRPELQGDRGRPPVLGRRDQQGGGRGRDGRGGGRDDRRDNRESDRRAEGASARGPLGGDADKREPPPPPPAQSAEQKPAAPPAEKVST